MTAGGKQTQTSTDVYAPIVEAKVGTTGSDQMFNVGGIGAVKMTDIKAFKY
jgi:hypothetical protein